MPACGGVGTLSFALLLCCWQDVQPWPARMESGSSSEVPSTLKNLDNDVATVFDEILVREILNQNKTPFIRRKRPLATSPPETTKKKKACVQEEKHGSIHRRPHMKESFTGKIGKLSFDEEEKEILFQIRSLTALEKIIESLRRAIGKHLMNKRRLHKSMMVARYFVGRQD